MFTLSARPLDGEYYARQLSNPEAGAFVFFEGRVRNMNQDRPVNHIEYEAAVDEAETEFRKIVDELQRQFPIAGIHCVHRTGTVSVGEVAIWVGVTAAHRSVAFAACQYAIDELKRRLPIWKKEHYADGTCEWLDHEPEDN
jgi:molybdopterin synthase catalytic subunit